MNVPQTFISWGLALLLFLTGNYQHLFTVIHSLINPPDTWSHRNQILSNKSGPKIIDFGVGFWFVSLFVCCVGFWVWVYLLVVVVVLGVLRWF